MRCPSSVNATTDGVVRPPSAFGMTSALPPSITAATTELVVPRSMPTAFAMTFSSVPGSGFDDRAPFGRGRRTPLRRSHDLR